MEHLFIDESGSMTIKHCEDEPFFIITVIRAKDMKKLHRAYKNFVRAHLADLEESDQGANKMFEGQSFKELKGHRFSESLKKKFVEYFCREPLFDLFYIVVDNAKLQPSLCKNTAVGFNYVLKTALSYWLKKGYIEKEEVSINLDERNERTGLKLFLERYLNTEIPISVSQDIEFKITYEDSRNNRLIQLADVFSNLLYSQIQTSNYSNELRLMKDSGILKHYFRFPLG